MQSTSSVPSNQTVEQALQSGLQALREKRLSDAEVNLKHILQLERPLVGAYQGLGETYFHAKRWNEAATMFQKAVALSPSPMGFHMLGQCYLNLKRPDEACPQFERATQLKPDWEAPWWFLGDIHRKHTRWPEALACYERLSVIGTDKLLAKNFTAQCLQGQGQLEEAERIYLEVIQERPTMPEPYCSLGALYRTLKRNAEVEANYLKAIELCPNFPEVFYNLGNFYKYQQRYPESEQAFRQAMTLRSSYIEAEWNLALVLLVQGLYPEGWQRYQARLSDGYFKILPGNKRWTGQSLKGKRVLVMREQGFGDTLQFLRYTPLLKAQGATVLFECKDAIHSLLETCPFIDELLPPRSVEANPDLDYDYWIPLMTLPEAFKTTIETIPPVGGLLIPDEARLQHWEERLSKDTNFRVGVAWTGNPENPYNVEREFPLEFVRKLATIPGVTFYSLQKENGLTEDYPGMVDLAPELHSFLDTAAVIPHLDAVLSVDSAVTHLAGNLGKPVWVALPAVADWRWGLVREDSPWYPSAQVFRQPESENWQPVYDALEKTLKAHLA